MAWHFNNRHLTPQLQSAFDPQAASVPGRAFSIAADPQVMPRFGGSSF
jgi:hypothetical protein